MDFIQYDDEAPNPQVITPVTVQQSGPGIGPGLSSFNLEINPECSGSDFLLGC